MSAFRGSTEESDIETGIVGDQHRAARELQKRGKHRLDPRRIAHHRRGDPGERDDLWRDAAARVHEGGELTEDLAAAHLDGADLGDGVVVVTAGAPARGLQVHDDEGGFAQRQVSQRIDIREAELAHALTVGNWTDKNRQAGVATPQGVGCRCRVDTVRATPSRRTAK